MNASCRSLCAAICLLAALVPGFTASGQFLQQEIIQADPLNAAQRQAIANFVDPLMDAIISGEPGEVTSARGSLLRPLQDATASDASNMPLARL